MIRGTFIGIDRYADSGIRDLTGAARDATALWALFSDTLPQMQADLICNENANGAKVREALTAAVENCDSADVVIVTFSGHGTHDHRLVLHDSDRAQLADTTMSADELSDLFKRSPAKALVFVIDCCFSGGAPGRVLEDSPTPKDPEFPFEKLAGQGRVILTACKADEVAYESPIDRHGLLTKALIEVLRAGSGTVEVVAVVAEVMERVRGSAATLGVSQTPVMFGYVEGGLVLPSLVAGTRFKEAFPERTGITVTAHLADLVACGIPQPIVGEWAKRFAGGLNDLQLTAVNQFRILDGLPLFVIAPTTSGKTFIGEMAAAKAISEGKKALFLLPYRALVNEKFDSFTAMYGGLGLRVVRCTGDYTDQVSALIRGKYDLAVLTYEMCLNLIVGNPAVLNQLGLVVLDEAQFITDPQRGITVELLLTFLVAARERGVAPQLIALSAVIGNSNGIEEWLSSQKLVTTTRPIPLIEGVLDRSGRFVFVDEDGTQRDEQLISPFEVQMRRDRPSAQDVIVPLVRRLVGTGKEKVIIFRNQRGAAEGCAHYLANELGLDSATDALAQLPIGDMSSTSASLRECLAHGTAFHNTNLTRDEKQAVEQAFRDPESPLRVLGATTTVAAGINTPASTVILAEQEFVGDDGRPFTVAEYKNMAGRAGRLGFNERGKSIILANDPVEQRTLFTRYVRGTPESLASSFRTEDMETWVVRMLAQVKKVPENEVDRLLASTYGGFLKARQNPGWRKEMQERVRGILDRMIGLALVERESSDVSLTLLGRACGQSSLSLHSAMRLVELLRRVGTSLLPEQLIALVQALPESDGGYTPLMKRGQKEARWALQAAQRFGHPVVSLLQSYVEDQFDYWGRCKRTAILGAWIDGASVRDIEQNYTATPFQGKIGYGDIRRFADSTRFHLRAAHQIASVLSVEYGAYGEQVDFLLKRLEVGLPGEALGLLDLPIPLERGDYLSLFQSGARSVDDAWLMSDEQLMSVLGPVKGGAMSRKRPAVPLPSAEH